MLMNTGLLPRRRRAVTSRSVYGGRKQPVKRAVRNWARAFSAVGSWRPYAQVHYSQEGEDIVLARIFTGQKSGFFVDIGAHHPTRFSNSVWAYRRGWSGINIDAAPGSIASFDRVRPRDTNIETCVSEQTGQTEFFVFPEPALNTAGRTRKEAMEVATSAQGQRVVVHADRLERVLAVNLPDDVSAIDFMSIDVEGSEMAVLRSNDWTRYRPRVIVIEVLGKVLDNVGESEEIRFLKNLGYVPVSMLYHSVVLVGDGELLSAHWHTAQG
jgi:FkbM family methyltransferase